MKITQVSEKIPGRPARVNDLIGWLLFAVAFITYLLTVEETGSYWDPGEFIAVSYKLQVPHPPGAPLFLLLGRMFSFLSFGDTSSVAIAINMLSVTASAFTIMFLYWTIVMVGSKLTSSFNGKDWLLYGGAVLGALCYAFSDSFWFSAVEAEVYGLSSFFTAFSVWAILKWELIEDERRAGRWLILIAYMIGLSIGVHLLNLLTIPVLVFVYYFRKHKVSWAGIAAVVAVSGALLVLVNNLIIPGLPTLAGKFEIFFVNQLGFFFGSGVIALFLLVGGGLLFAIRFTERKQLAGWNTAALGITFLLIGYGSYATIVIRSAYDTPINENAPKDVMSFVSYLKREQYGTWPILYGPYFTSKPVGYHFTEPEYVKGKDKYELSGHKYELEYGPGDATVLPRAWNQANSDDYRRIMGLREGQRPTFSQNISYMLTHQLGTMYARYFMWNFAGRESDDQNARWLFPSEWFKQLPAVLASNAARNNFFMIPFVMGLVGMFFQFYRDSTRFTVVAIMFFMLGPAIVLYLNSPPTEPRARDYIYAGSYYAYSVWIGLGVIGIAHALISLLKKERFAIACSMALGMTAPVLMLQQGWDDHDRSNRFFSLDGAANILNSCKQDGVVFTGGDNDTFPLWYAQEVEGCRTDVRVLVTSYCNTDWYIDQTTRQAYSSSPFRYTLPASEYRQNGPNDLLYYADAGLEKIDAGEYLRLLAKNFAGLKKGESNLVPSKLLIIKVDREKVLASGIIPKGMEQLIVDEVEIRLTSNRLEKKDLMLLDFLVTSGWERPIHLNPTSLNSTDLDLKPYAVQVGNVYEILPLKNPRKDRDFLVDTDRTFELMIHQFRYRGLDDSEVYYTDDYKMQVMQHRSNLNSLAEALIDKDDILRASQALAFSLQTIPNEVIPYDPSLPDTVDLLFRVGESDKAVDISTRAWNTSFETASWLVAEERPISFELQKSLFIMDSLQRTLDRHEEDELAIGMAARYEELIARLENGLATGRITQ
jgi:hypothetical protein